MVEIIDDFKFESDEQFYIKLSLVDGAKTQSHDVMLGRIFLMEISILNDDGFHYKLYYSQTFV